MSISIGERHPAVYCGGKWNLAPMCERNDMDYALAVKAGNGYACWGVRPINKAGDTCVSVRAHNGQVLLPVGCVEEGCEGDDPLCDVCPCESDLSQQYVISISGMPSVCDVDIFNGVWTVTYLENCHWVYQIDEWCSVHLNVQDGPFWRVSWQVVAPGGLSGYFGGYGGEGCAPQTQTFYAWNCVAPGCTGLCNSFYANAVAIVSLP